MTRQPKVNLTLRYRPNGTPKWIARWRGPDGKRRQVTRSTRYAAKTAAWLDWVNSPAVVQVSSLIDAEAMAEAVAEYHRAGWLAGDLSDAYEARWIAAEYFRRLSR